MLNIGYLVHWTTIVDHSREFLAFQRESIKNAGQKYEEEFEQIWNSKISKKIGFVGKQKILNKYEIVKYEGRFVGKQGGL